MSYLAAIILIGLVLEDVLRRPRPKSPVEPRVIREKTKHRSRLVYEDLDGP